LFGSMARGDFRDSSDVDLIIVSESWSKVKYTDRLSLLYRIWDKPIDATLIPLTSEELHRLSEHSVSIRDASQYWVEIYKASSKH